MFACFASEHLLWRLLFLGILAVACDALPFRVTIFCYLTNKLPKTVNREKAKRISEKPNWMKNKNQTTHAGGRTGRGWQGKHYPPLRAYVCVCVRVCGCASVWCQQKAQNFYARSFDLISAAIFFLVPCSTLATLGGSERREQEREGRRGSGLRD